MPLTIRPYRRSLRIASLRRTLISSEVNRLESLTAWLPELTAAVILEPCLFEPPAPALCPSWRF
jgi:hypothetical protein